MHAQACVQGGYNYLIGSWLVRIALRLAWHFVQGCLVSVLAPLAECVSSCGDYSLVPLIFDYELGSSKHKGW